MNEQAKFETYQGIVAPEPVWVKPLNKDKYGSMPDLDDSELADVEELERQIIRQEWWPILQLPVRGRKGGFRPGVDEDGFVVGAFGTVDFERLHGPGDGAPSKLYALQEKLKDTLILFDIVRQHLPRQAGLILKYIRMGIIELEHIDNFDMWSLAKLHLRAMNIQKQISWLKKARQRQVIRMQAKLFG